MQKTAEIGSGMMLKNMDESADKVFREEGLVLLADQPALDVV